MNHIFIGNIIFTRIGFFRIVAAFEVDNENCASSICNKTTNIYKRNPVLNGY